MALPLAVLIRTTYIPRTAPTTTIIIKDAATAKTIKHLPLNAMLKFYIELSLS